MISISYQGQAGAYSDIAIRKYFGDQEYITNPKDTFEELFQSVTTGESTLGMVPIENTTSGTVFPSFDLLTKHPVHIIGEIKLRIIHNLLVYPGTKIKNITNVYTHPQSILQCQTFFKKYPHLVATAAIDNGGSANQIAKTKDIHSGAIASSVAAKIYGLEILKKSIETNKKNYTRFVVIKSRDVINHVSTDNNFDKVSLVFSLNHTPGSLYQVLKNLSENNLNLTKIESRPILNQPWQYTFYVDFTTNKSYPELQNILAKVQKNCISFQVLGFYRQGKIINKY